MKRVKKKCFTLLEIMIVIFLIGMISAVVSFSMRGTMDEGKAFKTKKAKAQIKDILMLELSKDSKLNGEKVAQEPEKHLENSGLVKNPRKLLHDGWGNKFKISWDENDGKFKVVSDKYVKYKDKKKNNLSGKNLTSNS